MYSTVLYSNYIRAVDVWAIGCVFCEMIAGEPLFPGDSDIDQIYLIIKCLGMLLTIANPLIHLAHIIIGNLTPRHREIFRRNDMFVGMRLPEARELDPLEKRYPRVGAIVMDIIKVFNYMWYNIPS